MSVKYAPVGWSRTKAVYDAVVVGGVLVYLLAYMGLAQRLQPAVLPPDGGSLPIKAFGSCALLLMGFVLAIGPLARLDRRLLPLLYNRRHFGVITCAVAAAHAWHVVGWYFAFAATPPLEGLLTADTSFFQIRGFPFIPFGIAALAILMVLAFTSHDFWLHFLGAPLWKRLHMGIYAAYGLAVLHVGLGALQDARNPLLGMVLGGQVAGLCALHLAAGWRARREDAERVAEGDWVDGGPVAAIAEGRGVVVPLGDGVSAAVFRDGGRLSAISNLCAHQNGPLGEGRVIDGCVTCPWHGYQYRLTDGRAPAPFSETLATYRLRLAGGHVWLDRRANPPGTAVPPLDLP